MARGSKSLATKLRVQFATAVLAAAAGTVLGYMYAQYDLGENASRNLTAMYASFGAVAALVAVRVAVLAYRVCTD